MRRLFLIAASIALAALALAPPRSGRAQDFRQQVGDWRYPNAKTQGGGSAGSNHASPSYTHANMITGDPLADVIGYYERKLGVDLSKSGGHGVLMDGMTNLFENHSAGRPFELRTFQQHTKVYSLLLVVSRAGGEKETHIYWSMVYH